MAPRKSQRARKATAKALSQPPPSAVSRRVSSQAIAAAGLLALNRGIQRSRSRSQRPRQRRRGSSTTASVEDCGGGTEVVEEDSAMDLASDIDIHLSQEESNDRYRRQRGLPSAESNVPSSQPPSAQPARESTAEYTFNSDHEPIPIGCLKHFNTFAKNMIKGKAVSGETINTKDWSYDTYLIRETAKLQTKVSNRIGHSIVPPQFASEIKISAKGLYPALVIPISCDADIEAVLRAWYKVKYEMKKDDPWAQLTVLFEQHIELPPTPLVGTPNTSQSARRTLTNRQREAATQNAILAEAVGDHRTSLTKIWACTDATCRSNPKPCYPSPQYGHLPFTMRVVKDWCAWIRDGKATPKKMPPALLLRLMKENGKRVSSGSAKNTIQGPTTPGVNLYFGAGASAFGQTGVVAPSSPVGSISGDDDDNMVSYIDWLITQGHGKKPPLEEAKLALADEGWGWSDLKKISTDEWSKMSIAGGIRTKILKHCKAWEREGKPSGSAADTHEAEDEDIFDIDDFNL